MKRPASQSATPQDTAADAPAPEAPLPQSGGAWVRLADGSLRLEEATDNRPEARAAATAETAERPVPSPVQSPVKEA